MKDSLISTPNYYFQIVWGEVKLNNDKGSMALIKRNRAIAGLPSSFKHFNGFFAWLIWIFVHLMSLINIRNKITIFFTWLNSYITKDQPLRMIIDLSKK